MNRLVREHYPVSKLPEDLREGLEAGGDARVTVELAEPMPAGRALTACIEHLLALRQPPYLSAEQIDAHVRGLRDDWA